MVPPVLPRVDVRDVQLYKRDLDSQESVSDRNRCVRKPEGLMMIPSVPSTRAA